MLRWETLETAGDGTMYGRDREETGPEIRAETEG